MTILDIEIAGEVITVELPATRKPNHTFGSSMSMEMEILGHTLRVTTADPMGKEDPDQELGTQRYVYASLT